MAALLLVVAGAFKLVDPSGTVGALRALGVVVDDARVRVLAGAEAVLGAIALAVSHEVIALAVALLLGALGEAADPSASLLERLGDDPADGLLFTFGVLMLTGAAVWLFRVGRRPSMRR
jgi:hypothetical protein